MKLRNINKIATFGLSAIWLVSGYQKRRDKSAFDQTLIRMAVPPSLIRPTSISFSWLEMALGAGLLAPSPVRNVALSTSIGTYTVMTLQLTRAHLNGEKGSCGCLRAGKYEATIPQAIFRNLGLLALQVGLHQRGPTKLNWEPSAVTIAVAAGTIWNSAIIAAGSSAPSEHSAPQLPEEGEDFTSVLKLIEQDLPIEATSHSSHFVLFVSGTCEPCRNLMGFFNERAEHQNSQIDNLTILIDGDSEPHLALEALGNAEPLCRHTTLNRKQRDNLAKISAKPLLVEVDKDSTSVISSWLGNECYHAIESRVLSQ